MSIYRNPVKEGTFLHHYMQWQSGLETPVAYDFWCGAWLLSTVIGRTLHIPRPGAPVYLNLYIVLCADAGVTRKSTAVRRALETYYAVGLDARRKTITGSVTPEALAQALATQHVNSGSGQASLVSSELVSLLGREAYAGGLPGLLTDLYDCPHIRTVERTGRPTTTVRDVHITFLGASTAAWLARAINPDVVEGGFTSRCLFIVDEKRKRRVAWPEGTSDAVPDVVKQSLQHVERQAERWAARGINLNDNALNVFTKWYENRNDGGSDPYITSFESREDHHVLRLAAILAANDDCWLIEARHIQYATRIIDAAKTGGAALFGAGKANIRLVAGLDKLRDVLLEAGTTGISQTEVLFKTRTYMRARELEYALTLMHELEMVQRFEVRTGGRTRTVWRATNRITLRDPNVVLRQRFTD